MDQITKVVKAVRYGNSMYVVIPQEFVQANCIKAKQKLNVTYELLKGGDEDATKREEPKNDQSA